MKKFYNPYQFIPTTGLINGKSIRQDFADIAAGKAATNLNVRHDLWTGGSHSGRLLCSLYLDTPTVVGGKQHHDGEKGDDCHQGGDDKGLQLPIAPFQPVNAES